MSSAFGIEVGKKSISSPPNPVGQPRHDDGGCGKVLIGPYRNRGRNKTRTPSESHLSQRSFDRSSQVGIGEAREQASHHQLVADVARELVHLSILKASLPNVDSCGTRSLRLKG